MWKPAKVHLYRNINNCCYVNSTLRSLYSLEDFCFDLETSLVDVQAPLPILFDFFVKLMRVSEDDDEEELVDDLHWYVFRFIENLHLLDVTFGEGGQQDASEFCVRLLNHFSETVPAVIATVLRTYFEGSILQTLICQK
ncbi:hypothetical protein DAPPUDRAFT_306344 [Daphnia pulex]|uniref:USP domain-containing protein n=1 Tax=Daphnia pulex TaxID=6669 RepID=E9GX03_DAPPU|nr:hypothetical protein DAPPUDRAFT_306344 [Daphnia pulex]|eukprot:EFX75986.1 hypothetical protein DAPPUDRAFT_306344 [Daphnia pulex]